MNFLQETISAILTSGHTPEDIIFIGSEGTGHQCEWPAFEFMADRTYDNSYGSQEVATDLIIVFSDGTKMWRGEYDGSEWWEFSTPFQKPAENKVIRSLFTNEIGWDSLQTINDGE